MYANYFILGLCIIMTVITRITLYMVTRPKGYGGKRDIYSNKKTLIITHLFAIISLVLLAYFLTPTLFQGAKEDVGIMIIMIIISVLLYLVYSYLLLGLDYFKPLPSQILFAIIFISSAIILTNNYNENVETVSETTEQIEERTLLSFYSIPLQNVSGEIFAGRDTISGEISTSDQIPYWYLNENTNKGLFDTAEAQESEIIFIETSKESYVEIITYTTLTTEINNNNHTQRVVDEQIEKKYNFYLPQEMLQN